MATLLRLFGVPAVAGDHPDDAAEPLPPGRGTVLLVLLALDGGWLRREVLATWFWPDHAPAAARANLRKMLHRLRVPPGLPDWRERHGALSWSPPCDVQRFDAAIAAGRIDEAAAWRRGPLADGLEREAGTEIGERLHDARRLRDERWRAACLSVARDAADPLLSLQAAQHGLAAAPDDADLRRLARAAMSRAGSARSAASASEDFVGRQAELRLLNAALLPTRPAWVTLTGPGGIGKTRLATEFARQRAADGDLQLLVVELGGLAPDGASRCLAQALAPGSGDAPMVALRKALPCRPPTLLVLDELDGLADWARQLQHALMADPAHALQVLATSRLRLGVRAERLIVLDGLPWPESEDADRAQDFDAVRLFIRHAREAWPAFDPSQEREAIATLCADVQGHPLALKVAASWVRHQRVSELITAFRREGDWPQAPGGEMRGLQAVLGHSWQRLDDRVSRALARLSVGHGGHDSAAACAIGDCTLTELATLVDHSLLAAQRGRKETRFVLHPLVQHAASVRLAAQPVQADAAEQAHLRHYLGLLASMPPAERNADRPAWYAAADADGDNLRLAWERAVARQLCAPLGAAAIGLASWCHAQADWTWGLGALAAAEPLLDHAPEVQARLRCGQALLAVNAGLPALAARQARAALRVLRRGQDRRLLQSCLFYLGSALIHLQAVPAAERCLREMLAGAERDGDRRGVAHALQALSQLASDDGRQDQALRLLEQAVATLEGPCPPFMRAEQARLMVETGRADDARRVLADALRALPSDGPGLHRSLLLGRLAQAEMARGALAQAQTALKAAEAANAEGGLPGWRVQLQLLAAELALGRGDTPLARTCLNQAALDLRQTPSPALQRHLDQLTLRAEPPS